MTNIMIRMKDETLEQTDRLQKKLCAPSRSDVIRRAIGLSDTISSYLQKGDRLIIEGNGLRREVIIPGLSYE
jgi:metal-responsive CopG/Arc/MetJ family transcriptional regulator